MCIDPTFIWIERGPGYEKMPKGCGVCWRCRENRINDYVGRSLCEAAVSEAVACVTLTYAPRDDLADKIVDPRHFQLFMKLLRWSGHKVRYLVAAEYGKERDRAHFHALLFFKKLVPRVDPVTGKARGIVPRYIEDYDRFGPGQAGAVFCREIPQKRMVHIREWPHGHIKVDWTADEAAIRYICKYLMYEDKKKAWFSISKKPALGAEWFAQKAQANIDNGVLPSTFNYLPPGGDRRKTYLMTGATRRDYLNAITTDPAMRSRMSEWVGKAFDKNAKERLDKFWRAQPPEVHLEAFARILEIRQLHMRLDDPVLRERERKRLDVLFEMMDIGVWDQDGKCLILSPMDERYWERLLDEPSSEEKARRAPPDDPDDGAPS